MIENTLIDDHKTLDIDYCEVVQQKNKKYIKWAVFLALLDIPLYTLSVFEVIPSMTERLSLSLQMNLLGIPFIALLLALVFAFIPYRGLTWAQKYKRAALLTALVWYILITIGSLLLGTMLLYKYQFA